MNLIILLCKMIKTTPKKRVLPAIGLAAGLGLLGFAFAGPLKAFGQIVYAKIQIFTLILERVERHYLKPVSTDQLLQDAINGMLSKLDPHTIYLSADEYGKWIENFEGYEGIGASYALIDGKVTVVSIMEGGPAQKMGLRIGDRIVGVEGESIIGIKADLIPEKLKGPAGSRVSINVERPGLKKTISFIIRREKVDSPSVPFAFMLSDSIGYIKVARFSATTPQEFDLGFAQLREKGMNRLVVDLRDNTGGSFEAAIALADRFIPGGKIIAVTRGRTVDSNKKFYATGAEILPMVPLIVLINNATASSSEILAGAIQDLDRGILVGETSFGKAMVQSEYAFQDGSALLLTTALYYTPLGRLIQKEHETSADSINNPPRRPVSEPAKPPGSDRSDKTFRTAKGRIVYGEGGIVPDVIVKAEEWPEAEAFFNLYFAGPRFFFTFAEKFATENTQWIQNFDAFIDGFIVTEALYADFTDLVKNSEFKYSPKLLTTSKEQIKTTIKKEIANYVWGEEARFRVGLEQDNQLQQALAYFNEASQLLVTKTNKK